MLEARSRAVLKHYFLNNYQSMLCYAFSCLQNKSLAEIVVLDTFENAATRFGFDKYSDPVDWLYGVLKFKIREIRRERQLLLSQSALNLITTPSAGMVTDDPAFDRDEDFRLLYCLYVKGLSLEELAAKWKVSTDGMKTKLIQARKNFQYNAKTTTLKNTEK